MPRYRLRLSDDGYVEFREDVSEPWEPTVHHADIREKFINQASLQGAFTFNRENGLHPLDVTSYHRDLDYRSPDRVDLLPILHIFNPCWQPLPPWFPLPVQSVGYMRDEGRVVLDSKDKPIKDYNEIPLTCSSMMSGRDMELICRRNKDIGPADFRARMMPIRNTKNNKAKPQYAIATFSSRMTQFRRTHGLMTWRDRRGRKHITNFMEDRLSRECRKANSTLHGLDLDLVELRKLQHLERDEQYSKRAGAQAVSEAGFYNWTIEKPKDLAKLEEATSQQDKLSEVSSEDLCCEHVEDQLSRGKKRGMTLAEIGHEVLKDLQPDTGVAVQTPARPKKRNKTEDSNDIGTDPSIQSADTVSSMVDHALILLSISRS